MLDLTEKTFFQVLNYGTAAKVETIKNQLAYDNLLYCHE